ncbi:MAG: YitT family protein [Eubacteriales bacterium]|nr:YitT family protein [Eubacteriales bacterium]
MFRNLKLSHCIIAVFASALLAFGLFNIHSVADITEGGVLGMTLLLERWFNISPSLSGLILNLLCYIIGFKVLDKSFIGYSIISALSFSICYRLFELVGPVWPQIADYPLLAAILGAGFVGIGVGVCVRIGGAPSGDDALAMSISHISRIHIQWVYLICDIVVLALSLTYIPISKILYSLLTVVLSGQIIGLIQRIPLRLQQH